MKTLQKYRFSAVAATMLLGMGGCANMSDQDKSTASVRASVLSVVPF